MEMERDDTRREMLGEKLARNVPFLFRFNAVSESIFTLAKRKRAVQTIEAERARSALGLTHALAHRHVSGTD